MSAVKERRLRAVGERPPALQFAECVRAVTAVARRKDLAVPAFRSPPGVEGVDRTLRRRSDGNAVVAVRLTGRPFVAVQADVIDGFVAANGLTGRPADRFRRAAWIALDGRPPAPERGSQHLEPVATGDIRVA
jgi:hypothetical protein